jgi:hypothetical protein
MNYYKMLHTLVNYLVKHSSMTPTRVAQILGLTTEEMMSEFIDSGRQSPPEDLL